ncbi:hypothetical protein OSH11_20935 [Kaistia dalseonensis]|uniref:MOSC domain-containing protein n=1 Tax=Kaistia dalseonensis TaxID=410840 RepID=A0ABU0HE85_9HYPH|nr:hypothetical protein [Kaistia dalseonensis]MCX5497180.1 hypothetical protein [Kaistia dalseonensis]MDQ0439811.1 hypothetical protein [Kaistia dalseonensis]
METRITAGRRFEAKVDAVFIADGATIVIEGQNAPCRSAGRSTARHFPDRAGLDLLFPQKAKRQRGVVAWVEKPGTVRAGDIATVKLPEQRLHL